jgi:hypothetical protein
MNQTDRDRVQEVQLLSTPTFRDHQTRFLQQLEVFGHSDPSHRETLGQPIQRLTVRAE